MRIARILILASVLGVLTTVAVAWGLAAWLPQRNWTERHMFVPFSDRSALSLVMTEYQNGGAVRRDWYVADIATDIDYFPFMLSIDNGNDPSVPWKRGTLQGGSWGIAHALFDNPARLSPSQAGCEHAVGWPLLAEWYGLSISYPGPVIVQGGIPLQGISAFSITKASDIRALPLHPIWRGIIVNSLVYAAFWAGLFTGISVLRRALRRRAGRCFVCAYDLSGLRSGTLCPECGAARGVLPTPRAERDPA